MLDDLGHRAAIVGHYGNARQLGLGDRQSERLGERRHQRDMRRFELATEGFSALEGQDFDSIGDALLRREPANGLGVAIAHDAIGPAPALASRHAGKRPEGVEKALLAHQTAEEQDSLHTRRRHSRERGEDRVDTLIADLDPLRVDTYALDQLAPGELRGGEDDLGAPQRIDDDTLIQPADKRRQQAVPLRVLFQSDSIRLPNGDHAEPRVQPLSEPGQIRRLVVEAQHDIDSAPLGERAERPCNATPLEPRGDRMRRHGDNFDALGLELQATLFPQQVPGDRATWERRPLRCRDRQEHDIDSETRQAPGGLEHGGRPSGACPQGEGIRDGDSQRLAGKRRRHHRGFGDQWAVERRRRSETRSAWDSDGQKCTSIGTGMNYLFIVGCPRSGTTWVSWLLAQHPATVLSLHTGFFHALSTCLDWLERPMRLGNRVSRHPKGAGDAKRIVALADVVETTDLHAACRPLAEALFRGAGRANPDAEWVIEKTPENLICAELIRSVIPEARFLHVIRDPRAVFASMRKAAEQWAFPGDLPSNPMVFSRNFWLPYMSAGLALEAQTTTYRAVRYEDLLLDGPGELSKIFDWLALPADRALCERAVEASSIDRMRVELDAPEGFLRTGKAEGWRRELSGWQVRAIEYLTGDQMEHFGYHCSSPKPRRAPARLRLTDGLTNLGRRLARGPLARPLKGLFGWARRWVVMVGQLMTSGSEP